MIDYIDRYRDRFGVELICRILRQAGVPIAPSTYWAAKTRPPSARAVRGRTAQAADRRGARGHYVVCGVRRMRAALVRDGSIGRDHTAG